MQEKYIEDVDDDDQKENSTRGKNGSNDSQRSLLKGDLNLESQSKS